MRFVYGKQDMRNLERAQENCWLMTNGLGGFASMSGAFSVTKGDQGLLIAAKTAPCERYLLVQRMREQVIWLPPISAKGGTNLGESIGCCISTQEFADGRVPEEGYRYLSSFVWENSPVWTYEIAGLTVTRRLVMKPEKNTTAILYQLVNNSPSDLVYRVTPGFMCTAKGAVHQEKTAFELQLRDVFERGIQAEKTAAVQKGKVICGDCEVYVAANGVLTELPAAWEMLAYRDEACDGRTEKGLCFQCMQAEIRVDSGTCRDLEVILSDQPIQESAGEIFQAYEAHVNEIDQAIPFQDPVARQLARSADAYVTRRDSTGGKTIVAGYPFFGDWGRDTMIALTGCVLAPGQTDTAKSILRTFLEYEWDGLVPNLFPEGKEKPRYNTVDAALLLINCVWLYYQKTKDAEFVKEAYPVLCRIIDAYRKGTHHGIRMDADGLIQAGEGLDQVTWMDVCVEGILPTPRHGKPVEINAYWYNALKIMECFAQQLAGDVWGEKQNAGEAGAEQDTGAAGAEQDTGAAGAEQDTEAAGAEQDTGAARQRCNMDGTELYAADYAVLAEKVKISFLEKFWVEEKGYLKDVVPADETKALKDVSAERGSAGERAESISETRADFKDASVKATAEIIDTVENLEREEADVSMQIRCNQIWAVTMPFTMLSRGQEKQVVYTVLRELYTPCGLRTLAVSDPQFHPTYGGPQKARDLAYHQGTVWVFPLGAFYRGYLKVHDFSTEAVDWVENRLESVLPMLREGCVGQLPEIYDGLIPGQSKGCFAQAWSVGEILSVYEILENRKL